MLLLVVKVVVTQKAKRDSKYVRTIVILKDYFLSKAVLIQTNDIPNL